MHQSYQQQQSEQQPTVLPRTIEDLHAGLEHFLAEFARASDRLRVAGYAITNDSATRRNQILAIREALLAAEDAHNRLPQIVGELNGLLRRIDPCSEMLPEALPQ